MIFTLPFFFLSLLIQDSSCTTLGISWFRTAGNVGTKTISVGDTVTWTLTDTSTHTVTSTDGGFTSSGSLSGSGATYSVTFPTAGTYPFRCSIHTMMTGTISVTVASPTTVPTTQSPTPIPTIKPTSFAPTLVPSHSPTLAPGVSLSPTISPQPTILPTFFPTVVPTPEPTIFPTVIPTLQPTSFPTLTPSAAPTDKYVPFAEMPVISSNSTTPISWTATIEIREHRHVNSRVGFTTRSYCYQNICSYPGPTISLKPGDNLTLTVVNNLGPESSTHTHVHNTIHSPNTTNVHTHGLHISALVDNVFLSAAPGETLIYKYEIRYDHAPGLHWYHAHFHGSSTLQIMSGMVGALVIESVSGGVANIPESILRADAHVLVLTRLIFKQETQNGLVTQGCGATLLCDPNSQSPLCYGNETSSPWNPFRMYSLQELSVAAGSTLDIDPEFYATSSTEDYVLVNGLYRPVIKLIHDSPSLLQMVHAHGAGPLLMSIDGDDGNCSISILAWDGVYLDERIDLHLEETINLVAAGRVEVEIRCRSQGTFQMVENGEILFYLEVNPPPPEIPPRPPRPVISNEDLQAIVRPWYLQDLLETEEEEIDSTYTVFITQENFNQNLCGFWIGVGSNCGVITPFGSALPNTTENDQCGFHQFGGKRGLDPSVYERDHRLVTFKGAINEWILYGLGSAFHPLHVHVNHMQIISWNSSQDDGADSYYRRGQWRDTIPPIADAVKFRFRAADYEGETVMHCHFQRHEDLGMMDTYLVMNETAYADHYQEHKKNKDDDESAMLSGTVLIAVIVGVGGGILLIGMGIAWCYLSKSKAILPQ